MVLVVDGGLWLVCSVKLFVDSIVEDMVRILLTSKDGDRKSINTDIENLNKILDEEQIVVGRSYLIKFEEKVDFEALKSGKIKEHFKGARAEGKIVVEDTTNQDLAEIRRLQKRLRLRR